MRRPTTPPLESIPINAVLMAVRQAADAICDRWSFEILLAAFGGATRFSAFVGHTGMASRLVASRLHALEQLGVLTRQAHDTGSPRRDYRLTAMGDALSDVLRQMLAWEYRWRPPGEISRWALSGPLAGAEQTVLRCRFCGVPTSAREITPRLDQAHARALPGKQALRRRSALIAADRPIGASPLGESLDIFGDKWGIEILICSFFRVRRFTDFRACTGISANILSDRLDRLVALGVLSPPRHGVPTQGYWLTEKGVDLYGVTVAVQDWADAWLPDRIHSPVTLLHDSCGQPFHCASAIANDSSS